MTCPNCGHHVPEQRRIRARRKPTFASRAYKRVWMRAKRRGVTLAHYVRANVAEYHAGRRHDPDALELPHARRSA